MTASFSAAWLARDPRALSFLADRFRSRAARAEAVAAAAARPVAPALLDALIAANAHLPKSRAREQHLEALSRPGTVAVVTGQQVGLFLGPLFTVYKAASAIVTARALAEETGHACVPVFWLQTEDHDLPEIDHCVVPRGTGEPLRVCVAAQDGETSRVPVAHRTLGPAASEALRALRDELSSHPHAEEHLALLEGAYRPGATFPAAFAEVLSALFADEGLIVVDPRDPRLAPFAAPVHRRALCDAAGIAEALSARSAALVSAGFDEQVYIRPGAPLCFFSPDDVAGARFRLEPDGPEAWRLVGRPQVSLSTAALQAALEEEPRRFTTSALLRPLLQDTWLPVAAYVGGPGEVAYFAQLGPLYERFSLPMPLVVPRARFRVLDDRVRGLLEKLALAPDDASAPKEELLARLAARAGDTGFEAPDALEARLVGAFSRELEGLDERVAALDPSLPKAVRRVDDAVKDTVARFVAKYGRALAQRDQATVDRVERLQALLVPGGAPQERVFGLPYYACRFGGRAFTRLVLEACAPFSPELKDLVP